MGGGIGDGCRVGGSFLLSGSPPKARVELSAGLNAFSMISPQKPEQSRSCSDFIRFCLFCVKNL